MSYSPLQPLWSFCLIAAWTQVYSVLNINSRVTCTLRAWLSIVTLSVVVSKTVLVWSVSGDCWLLAIVTIGIWPSPVTLIVLSILPA